MNKYDPNGVGVTNLTQLLLDTIDCRAAAIKIAAAEQDVELATAIEKGLDDTTYQLLSTHLQAARAKVRDAHTRLNQSTGTEDHLLAATEFGEFNQYAMSIEKVHTAYGEVITGMQSVSPMLFERTFSQLIGILKVHTAREKERITRRVTRRK